MIYIMQLDLEIINSDSETLQDKRASLFNLLKKASKKGLKSAIYEALLINGYEQCIYDIEIFEHYLERPIMSYLYFSDKVYKAQLNKHDYIFREMVKYKPNIARRPSDQELIEDLVLHFVRDQQSIKILQKYFKKDWINGVLVKNRALNGGDLKEFIQSFGQLEADKFANKTILEFDTSTKRVFKRGEDVSVYLRLKNVSKLVCKMFTIDTANYYMTHMKDIDETMDLDGLLPQHCFDSQFNFPKQQQHICKINFEHIKKKDQGVFIAEFTGGNLSCRMIIKKGTLQLLPFDHFQGIGYYIIDEEKKICRGEGTGAIVDGRFHPSDMEGKIIFPFNKEPISDKKVIAVHEGFSYLTKLSIPREEYSLKSALIVNEEGLVCPQVSTIILRHQLYLNGTNLSLKKAGTCDVLIEMKNFEDLTNFKEFKNVELKDSEDVALNFAVPKLLSHIDVTTRIKFKDTRGEDVFLTETHTAEINRNNNEDKFCTIHLFTYNNNNNNNNSSNTEYALRLNGKNGEPIPNHLVQTQFLKFFGPYDYQHYLYTDSKGMVKLGQLEDIKFILVECPKDLFTKRLFVLPNDFEKMDIPKLIEMCSNERLLLPLLGRKLTRDQFEFVKVCQHPHVPDKEILISDCFELLKAENGSITAQNLLRGEYLFRYLLNPHRQIRIVVHEASRWEDNAFFLQKARSLTELNPEKRYLAIRDIVKSADNKLRFSFSSNSPTTVRAHVNAYLYYSECQDFLQISAKKACPTYHSRTTHLNYYQNVLLSNRVLSDEYTYILNRKSLNPFDGNTLDKPSILLHRDKVKETQDDEEVLGQGNSFSKDDRVAIVQDEKEKQLMEMMEDYEEEDGEMGEGGETDGLESNMRGKISRSWGKAPDDNAFFGKRDQKSGSNYMITALLGTVKKGEFDGVDWSNKPRYEVRNSKNHRKICIQNNMDYYIKNNNTKRIETNIRPEQNGGEIVIDLNKYNGYGLLQVYIGDATSCCIMTLPVNDPVPIKKDLRVKNAMKPGSIWRLDYKMVGSQKENDGNYYAREEGLSNCEVKVIDDIASLTDVLLNIAKPEVSKQKILDWIFLSNWDNYQEEQKLKYLEEYGGHELYLFLFVRDRDFFDRHVRMMISYKANKEAIDYLLLGEVLNVGDIGTLGPCELFLYMLHTNQYGIIDSIAQRCTNQIESKYFESVMSMNLQGSETGVNNKVEDDDGKMIAQSVTRRRNTNKDLLDMTELEDMKRSPDSGKQLMREHAQSEFEINDREDAGVEFCDGFIEVPPGELLEEIQFDEYKQPTKAFEFKERADYFKGQIARLSMNKFWLRLYQNLSERGVKKGTTVEFDYLVKTEDVLFMNSSNAEIICALIFTRLPLSKGKVISQEQTHEMFHMKSTHSFIALVKSTKVDPISIPLDLEMIANQKFFDPEDKYLYDSKDPSIYSIKEVKEFLTAKVYECRVSITNLGENTNEVTVISQVPEGSLPVYTLEDFKLQKKTVESMCTEFINFKFYFPDVGVFSYFPATLMKNNRFVSCSKQKEETLRVVSTYSQAGQELETLQEVVTQGSIEEILKFITEKNIFNDRVFSISKIRWVAKHSKYSFLQLLNILKKNFLFDEQIWAYSIYHGCYSEFRELISVIAEKFLQTYQYIDLGKNLKLVKFEPLEYDPLVNPRAHELLDKKINIRNKDFRQTYAQFLVYCCEKVKLELKDWVVLLGYWILQDRIEEAITLFNRIGKSHVERIGQMVVQFDYIEAYLSIYQESPEYQTARAMSKKYEEFCDLSWRERFKKIAVQIEEYDKGRVTRSEVNPKAAVQIKSNKELSEKTEFLAVEASSSRDHFKVTHRNIDRLKIQFFKLDLEILFSKDPFFYESALNVCTTSPNHELKFRVNRTNEFKSSLLLIPEHLRKEAMIVQVLSKDKFEILEMFNSELIVFPIAEYGMVNVQSISGEALHSCYVKCYAKYKDGGRVAFYKDGYTDFRGYFDFASLNSDGMKNIECFSLFVSHSKCGSIVTKVNPPSNVARAEFASREAAQENLDFQEIYLKHFAVMEDAGELK